MKGYGENSGLQGINKAGTMVRWSPSSPENCAVHSPWKFCIWNRRDGCYRLKSAASGKLLPLKLQWKEWLVQKSAQTPCHLNINTWKHTSCWWVPSIVLTAFIAWIWWNLSFSDICGRRTSPHNYSPSSLPGTLPIGNSPLPWLSHQ